MQTKQHCNEDAITAYLLGMAGREDANHVDACLDCYARVERARIEMEQMRSAAKNLASRPEHFWVRQRRAIMERATPAKRTSFRHWIWAPSAALGILALVLLLHLPMTHSTTMPDNRPIAKSQQDADDLLLQEIQSDLQRPVPRALQPATLLVQARNDIAQSNKRHTSEGVQE
jgi:anti-sigma factor RsiW